MTVPSPIRPGAFARVAEEFFAQVARLDEEAALGTVRDALTAGAFPESLLMEVVAPVQERADVLRRGGEWTVSHEHAAAYIGERAVGAVVEHVAAHGPSPAERGKVTVACTDGDWRSLSARVLSGVLSLRGWRVAFLGVSVPVGSLALHLQETGPDILALSCSMSARLVAAHAMIGAAHRIQVPVIAGGAGFGPDDFLARRLGADLWAPDALQAADLLDAGPPYVIGREEEALPASTAYAEVLQQREGLVHTALERAWGPGSPGSPDLQGAELDHAVEYLGNIVDFLLAALYVGDRQVFGRYLARTREALRARDEPADGVLRVLDVLEEELGEHPDALSTLGVGRDALQA
ncbi:cobalamin B12-binding domain-containing protein [Nocardiopsis algeriensis]|uniref:cobalamin B12-binding domain-containing protein n=1 Tax=Nocardiopsis algeriensis TaxID=1478215 RepID=UPI003B431C2E